MAAALLWTNLSLAQVVTDGDIRLSESEIAYAVANLPKSLQQEFLSDGGARYRVIARLVAGHKYKQFVDAAIAKDSLSDRRWELQYDEQALYRAFVEKSFQDSLDIPDLETLAEEEYRANYDEIARIPELRSAAHILVACDEVECDEEWVSERLKRVQAELERTGEFGLIARRMSDDRGTAMKAGLLSIPLRADSQEVAPRFRDALFALNQVGDISEPVRTEFGFHIIMLAGLEPPRVREFDEVSEGMQAIIEQRYRQEKLNEYIETFGPSDDLRIDEQTLMGVVERFDVFR